MITINTLTRDLLVKANHFNGNPTVRELHVTPSFYEYMCKQFNQRAGAYHGYTIKMMPEIDTPYQILLK